MEDLVFKSPADLGVLDIPAHQAYSMVDADGLEQKHLLHSAPHARQEDLSRIKDHGYKFPLTIKWSFHKAEGSPEVTI